MSKQTIPRTISGNLTGKAGGEQGLSMYHISPQELPDQEIKERQKPRIKFYRGASLMSAELGEVIGQKGKHHDWTRGTIKSFSKQSRRRILRLVASLKRSKLSTFITLTYPDEFERDPKKVKRHLDNFSKRLIREYPDVIAIWRMEPQERKSGVNVGEVAPHIHVLAWNLKYSKRAIAFVRLAWYEVVGSGNKKHFNAGTRVEAIRSTKGVMYYTAKYICKAQDFYLSGWGRYWGVWNRKKQDAEGRKINHLKSIQGELESWDVSHQTAMTMLRYMRRKASEIYQHGKFKGLRKFPKWGVKFTLIGDAERWREVLSKVEMDSLGVHDLETERSQA